MSIKTLISEIVQQKDLTDQVLHKIFNKNPKEGGNLYKKSEILSAYAELKEDGEMNLSPEEEKHLLSVLQKKRTRTISGVTPVTVLTKPFPCPGTCIFCPNDVRMPKSYLSDEPGAQRATKNSFDPYAQTFNRLLAFQRIGHPTDKIELIILGGTWTSYPEAYQIWFVKRCFDAMNEFAQRQGDFTHDKTASPTASIPYAENKLEEIHGDTFKKTYNQVVSSALLPKREEASHESATWEDLFSAQARNENAESRCVGLVIETRPDEITEKEVIRIRKLGATKVQIGFQSLNDEVLLLNKRGHDVETTKRAVSLLRQAGFKIHAHWMPNLYGSTPEKDILDFKKMFSDPAFCPDELKIYPCSLIESAELMQYYKQGLWKPYTYDELVHVLKECMKLTPAYCRVTRMIRDICSDDIVVGNKKTNLREDVEKQLKAENAVLMEVRSREIRGQKVQKKDLRMEDVVYATSVSEEHFLQYVTEDNKIAGFLRLSLPYDRTHHFMEELKGTAIIREVHVYGPSIEIGETEAGSAQHAGLGKALIERAKEIAPEKNYRTLAVISSIGTRMYYQKQGFTLKNLYQITSLS